MQRFGLAFANKERAFEEAFAAASSRLSADESRSLRFAEARDVFIEGDNLEALRLLRSAYSGRVKLIYIDPPYNTGHDFVYRDRWAQTRNEYLEQSAQIDAQGNLLVANPQTSGRFHSAWLAMMAPRLCLARELLREDGILFVSIDDNEVHHLRVLLDEIFGADCFIAQIVVVSNRGGRDYLRIATTHEYLLCYGASPRAPIGELARTPKSTVRTDARGPFELRELRNRNPKFGPHNRPNLFYPVYVHPELEIEDGLVTVAASPMQQGAIAVEPRNSVGEPSVWRWSRSKLEYALADGLAEVVGRQRRDGGWNVYEKCRKTTTKPRSIWDEPSFRSEQGTLDLRAAIGQPLFDHPKPVALVQRCVELCSAHGDLVMDFFGGSGTTAEAVARQDRSDGHQRRCVIVQMAERLPEPIELHGRKIETIADLACTRMLAVSERYARSGVRWFSVEPDPHPKWEAPDGLDGAGYLKALKAYERARNSSPASLWSVALRHGFTLDAPVRWRDNVALVDAPDGRTLAVCTRGAIDPTLAEHLAKMSDLTVALHDAALDVAGRIRLARTATVQVI